MVAGSGGHPIENSSYGVVNDAAKAKSEMADSLYNIARKSKPLNLNASLKLNNQSDKDHKLHQIGKLVDQVRILCDQPTEAEMSKKGAPNFRRP